MPVAASGSEQAGAVGDDEVGGEQEMVAGGAQMGRGVSEGDNIIHYPINRVATVGTSHSEVREAAQCLQPLFAAEGIEYHAEFITQEELKGDIPLK